MPEQIYAANVAGPFKALCGGGTDNDGSMEDCITVAPLEGGGYALKDSKLGDDSPELRFTKAEVLAFVNGAGELTA